MLAAATSPRKARGEPLTKRSSASPPAADTPSPLAGGRPSATAVLRRSASAASEAGSLTLENKNPSKLVVKPDGNIFWEMPTEPPPAAGAGVRGLLQGAAELGLVLSAASSGVMGIAVAVVELKRASEHNYCVTSQHLARVMASTVSSSFAGTLAGLAYAPLLAARLVAGRFARPAALAGAAWALARGSMHLLSLRGLGPAQLVAELDAAALAVGGSCLAAAEKVAARAAASQRFRRAFVKLGGLSSLLRLLGSGLDADAVRGVLRALAALAQEAEAQKVLVDVGGVAHLVAGLSHPDPDVAACCSESLARLARSSEAMAAVREAGGVPAALELLGCSDCPAPQALQLLGLLTALAGSGEGAATELAAAGATEVVLAIAADEPLPRTQVKEAAISTLHCLASSSPAHFAALRASPAAPARLAGLAQAYGRAWFSSRPALNSLLAMLAAADEAAAAAPIAGEAPELVERP